MSSSSSEIARRLALRVRDVCRQYLPNGKRVGAYWVAGDARSAIGKSLFVRLEGPIAGAGAAGRWSDAATGEHGDLVDLIAAACRLDDHRDAREEARRFLGISPEQAPVERSKTLEERACAARRLFAKGTPIAVTLAARYLAMRGIVSVDDVAALRFHPRCAYREDGAPMAFWPAMLSAVTDAAGRIVGVQRTYLARDGRGKARVETPRKALGEIAGNAVRMTAPEGGRSDILAAGEGVETLLSLQMAAPRLPLAATLSAGNLSAFGIPVGITRLYIAVDLDAAGFSSAERLCARSQSHDVEVRLLLPQRGDFNDDLITDGAEVLAARLAEQMTPEDQSLLIARR